MLKKIIIILLLITVVGGIIFYLTKPEDPTDEEIIPKLRDSYRIMKFAYAKALQSSGTPDTWNLIAENSPEGGMNIIEKIKPYLDIEKICTGDDKSCKPDFHWLGRTKITKKDIPPYTLPIMYLKNGISVIAMPDSPDCSYGPYGHCLQFFVDVNGKMGPNTFGEDIFIFVGNKEKLYPAGMPNDVVMPFNGFLCVNLEKDKKGEGHYGVGLSCAGWAIVNKNRDYLRCKEVSWEGKKSCEEETQNEDPAEQHQIQEQNQTQPDDKEQLQPKEQNQTQPDDKEQLQPKEQNQAQPDDKEQLQPKEQNQAQPDNKEQLQPKEQNQAQSDDKEQQTNYNQKADTEQRKQAEPVLE